MIEFVIQMYGFQRRMHWMLSGLMQQVDPPPFRVRIDTHVDDEFREYNTNLRRIFQPCLDIQWVEHDDGEFNYRGMLRDKALQESDADWLLFSDADMVYPPGFMAQLAADYLDTGEYDDALLAVRRNSPKRNHVDAMVAEAEYGGPIPDVYGKTLALWDVTTGQSSSPTGIGYFQLCRRVEALKRGTYCQDSGPHDVPLGKPKGARYGSDV